MRDAAGDIVKRLAIALVLMLVPMSAAQSGTVSAPHDIEVPSGFSTTFTMSLHGTSMCEPPQYPSWFFSQWEGGHGDGRWAVSPRAGELEWRQEREVWLLDADIEITLRSTISNAGFEDALRVNADLDDTCDGVATTTQAEIPFRVLPAQSAEATAEAMASPGTPWVLVAALSVVSLLVAGAILRAGWRR